MDRARKIADAKYKKHGAYKSMFLVSTYKKLGGRYSGKKPSGVNRWIDEEWIQVIPYLTKGQKVACGTRTATMKKVCRPFKRINKKTPITLPELRKLHSDKELIALARKKQRNMSGRVFWRTLKFTPK